MPKSTINEKPINEFAKESLIEYGSYTIEDRAIPDYRDGLKPVHRRILWAMHKLDLRPGSSTKKSARVVGDVIGKYHPHGDAAVYGALVNMVNLPSSLIYGQGNFGFLGQSAAAMRYCVTADTIINTNYGLKTIKSLKSKAKKGLVKVQSLNGQFMPVSNWIYSGKHVTRIIEAETGFILRCTPNHPFLVLDENWNFVWKDSKDLTENDYVCINREGVDDSNTVELQKDYAKFLGFIVGDGCVRKHEIRFSTAYKSTQNIFEKLLNDNNIKYNRYSKEPTSHGKRRFVDFSITDNIFRNKIDRYGCFIGNSYDRVVPKAIFTAPISDVKDFISSYFDSYGSISIQKNNKVPLISFNSVSKTLLEQIKLLLQQKFGVISTIYSDRHPSWRLNITGGVESIVKFLNTFEFMSKRKRKVAKQSIKAIKNIAPQAANSSVDIIPYAQKFNVHKTIRKCKYHADYYKHLTEDDANKLKAILDSNYLFAKVTKNKKYKKEKVYDLTVPETHAFTANGFVVHNTECRLTNFTDKVLLDKKYLAVTEFNTNYDGSETEPVVLPALLPNILFNGSQGIAVGVTIGVAQYDPKGILELLKKGFSEEITPKLCVKYLKPITKFGGVIDSPDLYKKEALEYFKTGSGILNLQPEYEYKNGVIRVTGIPVFTINYDIENVIAKIQELDNVAEVKDFSSVKVGVDIQIRLKKLGDVKDENDTIKNVIKIITPRPFSLKTNLTIRRFGERTKFKSSKIPEMLNEWIKWRINLEVAAQKYIATDLEKQINYHNVLIFACNNLEAIFKVLKSGIKDDKELENKLAKTLKISNEDANIILGLQVRKLSRLSEEKEKQIIKDLKVKLNEANKFIKKPKEACLLNLANLEKLFKG